jgi:hypothetical protein
MKQTISPAIFLFAAVFLAAAADAAPVLRAPRVILPTVQGPLASGPVSLPGGPSMPLSLPGVDPISLPLPEIRFPEKTAQAAAPEPIGIVRAAPERRPAGAVVAAKRFSAPVSSEKRTAALPQLEIIEEAVSELSASEAGSTLTFTGMRSISARVFD